MTPNSKKPIVAIVVGLLLIGGGIFLLVNKTEKKQTPPVQTQISPVVNVIGRSVEGRNIEAYSFLPINELTDNQSIKHLLFIGGIHGGYEWNSVILAYQIIDYLKTNREVIPVNLKLTIIPSANPDGIFKVTNKEGIFSATDVTTDQETLAESRFNKNAVDLNRNFDCNWQQKATWKGRTVSAGTKAFSEPEAEAIKNYILENKPTAVIFWHSQANAVYASECNDGILPETLNIMNTYATAADYPAVKSFDSYKVTGDAEGWLASIGIPAITVELKSHEEIDLDKNLAGLKAILEYYNK